MDWEVSEERWQRGDAAPEEDAWPEECGGPRANYLRDTELLLTVARFFDPADTSDSETASTYAPTLLVQVAVFARPSSAIGAYEDFAEARRLRQTEECRLALEENRIAASEPMLVEDPKYHVPGSIASRESSIYSGSPTNWITGERHAFVRGRVFAIYYTLEAGELPPDFDLQTLLELFETRVVAAQE